MPKVPKIVPGDKMHNQLNRFNWTNFSIKLNWLTWLNNQTSKNSIKIFFQREFLYKQKWWGRVISNFSGGGDGGLGGSVITN